MVSLAEKSPESDPATKKTPLAEKICYTMQARGIEGWFEFVLGDGRPVVVATHCLPWEDLPLPDSLDLTDMETWCRFHENLEERGMDSYFTFFLFIGEIERRSGKIIPGSFSNFPYSDKETVEFLELLGTEHRWGFGIEEVIPDDVAKALMQTLELEA